MSSARLAFHEEAAASRDVRFSGWNTTKAAKWRAEVQSYLGAADITPNVLEQLKADRWSRCGCGREFQPGEKNYRWCYTCSAASYAEGSTACAVCQRRHSMKYPCCKACTTNGQEDTAILLRSVVMRRDGYACNACGETEGQLDVHHINPDGSAWAWNCEILCCACWLTMKASREYGPLDEMQWLQRAVAYDGPLAEFLTSDERMILRTQLRETLGSDYRAKPARLGRYGVTDEMSGLVNVLDTFGREGIVVEHA